MKHNIYSYILVMGAVTYMVRVLPLTILRREVKNVFARSFLYYVPYVTLAVMTFPAILDATDSPVSGALALLLGIGVAWFRGGLFPTSAICCLAVFVSELFLC